MSLNKAATITLFTTLLVLQAGGANQALAACSAITGVAGANSLVVSFSDARMATSSTLAAADGRLVYDSTAKALKLCNGTDWVSLLSGTQIPAAGTAAGQVQVRGADGFLNASSNLVLDHLGIKVLGGGNSYNGWAYVPFANLPANDLDLLRGNHGGQTAPYRINQHSGLSLSAHSNYGGIRFYNQGYNASFERPYVAADGASLVMTITNGRVGIGTYEPVSTLTVNGLLSGGIGTLSTIGVLNWNDITNARSGSGNTLLLGSHSNGPTGTAEYFYPFSFEYSAFDGNGNMTQFAIPYGAPNFSGSQHGLYLRSRYVGTWGSWRFIPMQAVSDYRVKTDVKPTEHALDTVMQIKPVSYQHTLNQAHEDGFIAHELAEILPYAVNGEKDAIAEDGSPRYQSVDYGRLTPVIVKAMIELKAENDALRARIEALEAERGQ